MVKIGLEIHGYLETKEKLFCRCKSIHGAKLAKPNTYICPICTAQPGAKPMLPNQEAVEKTIQAALILGCKINKELVWQRKHYDWPDLPKGYQNTISGAHSIPLGEKGEFLGIRIRECHLEEDPAAWNPKTGEIDYNRSGSPLIEIVTEPDFSSSEKVVEWLKQLVITLGYIKTIDKSLGLKADVNISLPELNGERVEIKNVNSLRNITSAIEYEESRQKKELPKSKETRMFDESRGITKKMREKEGEQDYRFISEPDLPMMKIPVSSIEKIRKEIPETPQEKLQKLVKKYNLEKKYAEILSKNLEITEFFEAVAEKVSPKIALPWVSVELLSVLNYNKKELDDVDIKPEHFIELLKLLEKKAITELKAKDILRKFIPKSFSPQKEAEKSAIISSKSELEDVIKKIIRENPEAVNDYKSGKKESINFLVGKVMSATNKRADFRTARDVLEKLLR
ncbi:MAG: Asp-tRNA(Asn)/Glu-tRNA(Gln) amidotransferase subunit GatB [Candidatus Nanoarchaeia archaeon]|nr:Asp-tRNA(Asn)/Glu-tRNA(Gln) amidotransferase subunit GatB [Candidatus Nanoarchaeia archaeon]